MGALWEATHIQTVKGLENESVPDRSDRFTWTGKQQVLVQMDISKKKGPPYIP